MHRRSPAVEACVGLVLLAAVGALVGQPPPLTSPSAAAEVTEQLEQARTGTVDDLVVTVSATPNRPGANWFTGGFTGAVTLKVAGLPTGSSATWVGNPITVPGSATLKVRTTGTTTRGTFTLKLTGTSGALVHQVSVTLIVR